MTVIKPEVVKKETPHQKDPVQNEAPKKTNGKKGYRKTYDPIKINSDSIELSNVTIFPATRHKESTSAYGWQRKGSYRDDYCINIRVFGVFQTSVSWKVAQAMCDLYAGTVITTVEEWKELNKIARKSVTSIKGGPQYVKSL